MKLQEVTLYENRSHRILKEGWQDLTEAQQTYQLRFEKELWPLVESYKKLLEQELSPKQIQSIFANAEQVMNAGGDNKTLAGKVGAGIAAAAKLPVDIAKKIDAKVNELGRMAQNAGPIKNADQKFEQLKKDIAAKNSDSKIVQGIQKVSDWAKENPGKASLAVGILTTIAAFAGGPAGGAAAGLILRASKDLLQGEKLSTAIGKSVKTAAYGAIAGWAMRGIGDWLEGLRADAVPYEKVPGLTQINVGLEKSLTAPGFSNVKTIGSLIVPADQAEQLSSLVQAAKGGDVDAFNQLWDFSKTFNVREYKELANATNDMLQAVAQQNDAFLQNLTLANDAIAAIAQGSVQAAGKKTEFKVDGEEVTPDQNNSAEKKESIDLNAAYEKYLQEAGFADMIKKGGAAVGKAAAAGLDKVKQGAAAVGKELGQQVTTRKLNKMWQKAGSPTDVNSIINILQQAGVPEDQIATVGAQSNTELKRTNTNDVDPKLQALADEIKKLGLVDVLKPKLADG